MKTHILRGSKQEIAEGLERIHGEILEAIVFEKESAGASSESIASSESSKDEPEDLFAEMKPYMVDVQAFDDSREAIYTRLEGE